MDEVKNIKSCCLSDPENYLWSTTTNKMQEVRNIFHKINELKYEDKPDYDYIREQLKILLQKEEGLHTSLDTGETLVVNHSIIYRRRELCLRSLA